MAFTNGDNLVTDDDLTGESTSETGATEVAPPEPVTPPTRRAAPTPEPEEPAEVPPKPNGRAKEDPHARVTQATAAAAAARRERDEAIARASRAEAELANVRKGNGQPTVQPNPKPTVDDPEPTIEEFVKQVGDGGDAYTPWLQAHTRWTARDEFRKQQHAAAERTAHESMHAQQKARATAYMDRLKVELAKDSQPLSLDGLRAAGVSDAVMALRPAVDLEPHERPDGGTAIADYVADSENPLALMRYLSENDNEFQAMLSLHPMQVFGRMGRIEERMIRANTLPARESSAPVISAAPRPIKPVGGSPVVSDDAPPDDSDLDSHIKWHNQRDPRFNPRAARH